MKKKKREDLDKKLEERTVGSDIREIGFQLEAGTLGLKRLFRNKDKKSRYSEYERIEKIK